MITGAQAMVRCLEKEGVDTVFGYPGATIAPFYDKLSSSGIRHILTRSEQGAGHAANGYARITGKPGVCVATSGPGATNLFTSIATAYSDSIPLVAITGQVNTFQLGRDVFQEVDTTGAAEPFTKYAFLVKSPDELGRVFKEAFYIASTGRKGPVLIDIPVDIQRQSFDFTYPDSVAIRGYKPCYDGHPLQIKRVAAAISKAKRPVLCCGGGVFLANAQGLLKVFCEETGIPAVSTMMGIGALAPEHPLYYGMIGGSGASCANLALEESDLLVLIGARVGDRAVSKPSRLESSAAIVHIDIDTAEIGKNVGTTIPLVGDAARVLSQLMEKKPRGHWPDWLDRLNASRGEKAYAEYTGGLDPNVFVRTLCDKLPEKSVYVADVGQNQMWSAGNFTARGRFLTTGGMGTMGYSIPAAIGAKLASPDSEVVAVCGDGAFQMSMNELATMIQHNIPVKVAVMKNLALGLVREIQRNDYNGREFAVDLDSAPDLSLIAKAYGIGYWRLDATEDCAAAVEGMLKAKGAYLLECVMDAEETGK